MATGMSGKKAAICQHNRLTVKLYSQCKAEAFLFTFADMNDLSMFQSEPSSLNSRSGKSIQHYRTSFRSAELEVGPRKGAPQIPTNDLCKRKQRNVAGQCGSSGGPGTINTSPLKHKRSRCANILRRIRADPGSAG